MTFDEALRSFVASPTINTSQNANHSTSTQLSHCFPTPSLRALFRSRIHEDNVRAAQSQHCTERSTIATARPSPRGHTHGGDHERNARPIYSQTVTSSSAFIYSAATTHTKGQPSSYHCFCSRIRNIYTNLLDARSARQVEDIRLRFAFRIRFEKLKHNITTH